MTIKCRINWLKSLDSITAPKKAFSTFQEFVHSLINMEEPERFVEVVKSTMKNKNRQSKKYCCKTGCSTAGVLLKDMIYLKQEI